MDWNCPRKCNSQILQASQRHSTCPCAASGCTGTCEQPQGSHKTSDYQATAYRLCAMLQSSSLINYCYKCFLCDTDVLISAEFLACSRHYVGLFLISPLYFAIKLMSDESKLRDSFIKLLTNHSEAYLGTDMMLCRASNIQAIPLLQQQEHKYEPT